MQADIQQYFVDHGVRNFYSVSIFGYHIAGAGVNPISQIRASSPAVLVRRRPETTLTYKIIREHWPKFQAGGGVLR